MKNWQHELKAFIRRYYGVQIAVGLLWFLLWTVGLYIGASMAGLVFEEYPTAKTVVFFSSLLLWLGLAVRYWLPGLLVLIGWKKGISDKEAASLVVRWIPTLEDRLVNALELHARSSENSLWEAAANQRDMELSDLDLKQASSWSELKTFWWVPIVALGLPMVLMVTGQWAHIQKGSESIWAYTENMVETRDWRFQWIEELPPQIRKGATVNLAFESGWEELIAGVELRMGGRSYWLTSANNEWLWQTPEIMADEEVGVFVQGVKVLQASIKVVPNPVMQEAAWKLSYPPYTGRGEEVLPMQSVLVVPRGTRMSAQVNFEFVQDVYLSFSDRGKEVEIEEFSLKVLEDEAFRLVTVSLSGEEEGWMKGRVRVINDEWPRLTSEWSINENALALRWRAEDDYGLSKVYVEWRMQGAASKIELLSFTKQGKESLGEIIWDLSSLASEMPDLAAARLVVIDNDAINGGKATYGSFYELRLQTEKEKLEESWAAVQMMEAGQANRLEEEKELEQALKESLAENRTAQANWKARNELRSKAEELKKEDNDRKQRLEERKEILKEWRKNSESENLKELEERLKELERRMERNQLEELLEEFDKQNKEELLKRLEQERERNAEMRISERRMEELMKRAEVELRFENSLQELEKLQKDQQALAESALEKDELKEKQLGLEERLEKWEEAFEELMKRNEALNKPMDIEGMEAERQEAKKEMKEASEATENPASSAEERAKEQKESAEQLQKMLEEMQAAGMSMSGQSHSENMETLRQIQDNLLVFSNGEESIAELLFGMPMGDPALKKAQEDQQKMRRGAEVIKDSLRALGERVPQIKESVFEKLYRMDRSAEFAQKAMGEMQTDQASSESQYAMTAANELALMLDETMQQMQMQMASMMQGNANCNKPGGAKPSAAGLAKAQQELMKGMQKGMKGQEGGKEGEGKSGKDQGKGKDGELSAKEFADLLKQQEALREMWQELMKDQNAGGGVGDQKTLKLMQESERELAAQHLNERSILRQKDIESRLLEAEKAERQRGEEEKRESGNSKLQMEGNALNDADEPNRKRSETERLKTQDPEYQLFYKDRIEKWLLVDPS